MGKLLFDEEHLQDWVNAAEGIEERFGIDKAMGYLIGEKFYNIVDDLYFSQKMVRNIEEKKKSPDYNPIRQTVTKRYTCTENLDETLLEKKEKIVAAQETLSRFASLIKEAFPMYKINQYLKSHPRLGVMGHVASEEDHDFMIEKGVVEHSLETEVEDAMILGDMMKYFGVS